MLGISYVVTKLGLIWEDQGGRQRKRESGKSEEMDIGGQNENGSHDVMRSHDEWFEYKKNNETFVAFVSSVVFDLAAKIR